MTTAFVTGASGFIGGHLVTELVRRGVPTRCLVRPTSKIDHFPADRVELVRGDLNQPQTLLTGIRGADVVYHLAGRTEAFSGREFRQANVRGTYRVARACALQARPPVLIVVSSLSAAGTSRQGRLRVETDPPAPISHYGRSKRAGERVVEQFAGHLPITILRPGIVFGPRDRNCLKMFKPIARFGVHAIPGYQEVPLSLIYVEDLVDMILAAAGRGTRLAPPDTTKEPVPTGYYFACMEEHPNYLQLGQRIARALDRRHVYLMRHPEWAVWLGAVACELAGRVRGKPDIFNPDKVREATAGSWECRGELARRELNCPQTLTLDERLRETASWYRDHHWI